MTEPLETYRQLIETDDPAAIAVLEAEAGLTQAEAVTHFIEHTCWGEDVAQFKDGQGSPAERLEALRAAFKETGQYNPDDEYVGPDWGEEITHSHPAFPFIKIHIKQEINAGELGAETHVSSSIDGNPLEYGSSYLNRTPEACLALALRSAEQTFFREEGAFYHLRMKMDEAADRGDLPTLCALAEGRGYWRGIDAAERAHIAAIQGADHQPFTALDPLRGEPYPAPLETVKDEAPEPVK